MTPTNRTWMESVVDVAVAGGFLILVLPLMAIIAFAIKFDSAGPVFQWEELVGPGGGRYTTLKFRTEISGNQQGEDPISGPHREGEFSRVGWLLWYTRLDKLPQLISVLSGEMSCIGDRSRRPRFLS